MKNPYDIVKMFEEAVAEYTGAPYAVAVDSCTNALFLCMKFIEVEGMEIVIPKRTYLSVPMSIINAGGVPVFDDMEWSGQYPLYPLNVVDSAKRFTSGMYQPNWFICLSFHIRKTLPIGKGGMILCDKLSAYNWFKRARYEGRGEVNYKEDQIWEVGWNMYMTPEQAARGLALMQHYPEHVPDLEEEEGYRDLTEFKIFKKYKQL